MIRKHRTLLFVAAALLVVAMAFAQPAMAQNTTERRVHTVAWGETLFSISQQYGLSVDELMRLNGLSSTTIYPGQTLVVVGSAPSAVTPSAEGAGVYTVVSGDTLFGIAQRFNTSVSALVNLNGLINPSQIVIGQQLSIPGSAGNQPSSGYTPAQSASTHVVQVGETIYSISRKYGVSAYVLAQSNNLSNPSLLYVGQQLVIPSADALNTTATTSTTSAESAVPPVTSTKSIVVDISDQRTYTYENGELQYEFVVSTGIPGRDTWRGEFQIQNKILNAYASTWDLQMPYWLGFYWAGSLQNGFHALPILSNGVRLWEGLLGQPASYGCVILSNEDAQTLYYWAEIGTPVTVRN